MVEGEEEAGEWLAHREGRRRLAGRVGLEKFFWPEEEETEDSLLSCGETNELPFKITPMLYQQSVSHTQILYIVSRVPSVVFLALGENNRHISNRNTRKFSRLTWRSHIPFHTRDKRPG